MFGIGKSTRKRRLKYKVDVKGTTVSRHYTITAARKAAKSIRGARVSQIGRRTSRRRTYRKRTYRRR